MLQEGQRLPDFTLLDTHGKTVTSKDLAGKKIVIYFYPKDETSGCTIEACNFRDDYPEFIRRGARVIGVSMDDERSHQDFARKFGLPFELLCDTEGTLSKLFGAYNEGVSAAGRPYKGVSRMTFVIDGQGVVRKVFANANQNLLQHSQEVLQALEQI